MKRKIIIISILILICVLLSSCKSTDYKKAIELQESGNYQEASVLFQSLGDYQDSVTRLKTCNDYIEAIDAFNEAKVELNSKNTELDNSIEQASKIAYTDSIALDESIRPVLETAISECKAAKVEAPDLPGELNEILMETKNINSIDYSEVLGKMSLQQKALEKSLKQYELVNNPEEAYVISCLKRIEGIVDIAAATEDNDPNGNLHKAGGYTSAIYFSHNSVDQSRIDGITVIDKGTKAGGQIEVYSNEDDANKRNSYLASFDGTVLSTGSHTIIGTCVIRTSNELTASQQNELSDKIIQELIKVD